MPGTARGDGGPPTAPTQHRFVRARGGASYSMEEDADLQGSTPARAHLSLWELYGELPHHNDGTRLAGGVPDDAIWKSSWRRLAAKSASWYFTPPGKVGRRFTGVLAAE